jgi:HAD superfamily hydrolase (TIGR01509 family)
MSKPKAIIFDMDGVLTDSEWFIAEAGCRMFHERWGLNVVHDDFAPFVGLGENRFLGGVAEKYALADFNIERDKARTYEIYLELVAKPGALKALPGSVAFLRRARELGLKTALATSTDYVKMTANLKAIGLGGGGDPAFDATVNGLEVERQKPFPDLYLEAASRIGAAPADCWVVEDSVGGVKAAKTAGMRCLALLTTFGEAEVREAGADRVVRDLSVITPEELL